MTPGRRNNPRLEQRRRNRISFGLKLAYASGRRKTSKAQIERWKNVNIGCAPWNKGKTVENDNIYSPKVLKRMSLGQRLKFSIMSPDQRMKITENMRRVQLLRWQRYREKKEQEREQP